MIDKAKQNNRIQLEILNLTSKQLEILRLLGSGRTIEQIALQLGLTATTVRTYKAKAYAVLRSHRAGPTARPPINAEYMLYLLLRKQEREVVIGDLTEEYSQILVRFNKRRADIWFYKQLGSSLLPFLRRALLRVGALVWLGRILRRLVS